MKLAIYQKFLNPEVDPLDIELHCWQVEADDEATALEILEKRADVPWRMYLVEVIDKQHLEQWLINNEINDLEVYSHE